MPREIVIVRPILPTREAAMYCGARTTGALRKALEGRVYPVGRRGSVGTWMWAVEVLDRFLRGEPPPTVAANADAERSGAAPHGEPNEQEDRLEVDEERLDRAGAGVARRVATDDVTPFDTSEHATYTEEEPNSLLVEEVPPFLGAMRERYPQHDAMTYIGLITGLRPSTLRPLRRRRLRATCSGKMRAFSFVAPRPSAMR